ncbi:helix-turn-helix domain-containing protein [Psychrobacillus psychrotolerans]|uniref:helix-turn-helix domain-containing protein n=1 Tax=Psychrobacillus psychrotolerans TaxID=126156 RepID=UPI003B02CFD4
MSVLGKRLKEARLKNKLTQIEAAKKLGISNGTLSGYERDYRDPDTAILERMASLYEVTTDYLLGISGDKEPVHREAGISDNDYNNLSAYQKEVIDFFVTREQLSFKNQPENILDALEQFEVFYEVWKKQQDKKK